MRNDQFVPDQEIVDFALSLTQKAGAHTARYFNKNIEIIIKDDQSPVTVADRETEALCRKLIEEKFPEHGIVGEEWGEKKTASSLSWTIDPIDGTKSFISGIPIYTFLLSLLHDGNPVLGIIHQPILGETIWGIAGKGTWFNSAPTSLRPCSGLSRAWMLCTDPTHLLKERPAAKDLFESVALSRSWGDGYGYLMLASGRADIMIDPAMYLWDIAPLKPVIEGAGGVFTDMNGTHGLGTSVIAAGSEVHAEVVRMLNPVLV